MKHLQAALIIVALTGLAACGGTNQYVSRSDNGPLGFAPIEPDLDGSTSERASIDLLSLG